MVVKPGRLLGQHAVGDMVASQERPGNLPLQPTSLVGRDQELVALAAALNRTRLLTLTGVGGVGKTRLALALAEGLSGAYVDGTWFIELAPLADAALVPQSVATVVGVPLAPGAVQSWRSSTTSAPARRS
jgi:predicted ATPase